MYIKYKRTLLLETSYQQLLKMNFKNREIVIKNALKIERITSILIKHLIGIHIQEETRSLDNKSSVLSLKSKIDLLYDSEKLDKKQYSNILHIMSIRNQFAHNYECNDFADLAIFIDGINKPLLKYVEEQADGTEANLKRGFNSMVDDVMNHLKVEFESIISDYKKSLRRAKYRLDEEYSKMLDYYGIKDPQERKEYKPVFQQIIEEEKRKGIDETLDERVKLRVIDLLKLRIEKLEKQLVTMAKKKISCPAGQQRFLAGTLAVIIKKKE